MQSLGRCSDSCPCWRDRYASLSHQIPQVVPKAEKWLSRRVPRIRAALWSLVSGCVLVFRCTSIPHFPSMLRGTRDLWDTLQKLSMMPASSWAHTCPVPSWSCRNTPDPETTYRRRHSSPWLNLTDQPMPSAAAEWAEHSSGNHFSR